MQKLQCDAQAEGRALLRVLLLRISGVSTNARAARVLRVGAPRQAAAAKRVVLVGEGEARKQQ